MGWSKGTGVGAFAVDISSDNDALFKNYVDQLIFVKRQIVGVDGMTRSVCMAQFNESYMYGVDIRKAGLDSILMYHIQDQMADMLEKQQYAYLRRVLNFCMSGDFVAKTGLSVKDLMHLDFATFEFIEKMYLEFKPVEQDNIENVLRDLEKAGKFPKKN